MYLLGKVNYDMVQARASLPLTPFGIKVSFVLFVVFVVLTPGHSPD